jgi:hypothetical protein
MQLRGPTYLHAVINYESNVVRWNKDYALTLRYPLVLVYISGGTFWVNHPICLLDGASWVTAEMKEVGNKFITFVTSPEQQSKTTQFGIRPADIKANLVTVDSLININYGVNPAVTIETIDSLPYPDDSLISSIQTMWASVKKPTTFCMIIDTSGSMATDNKIGYAASSASQFISRMNPQDQLYVYQFNTNFERFLYSADGNETQVSVIRTEMMNKVANLFATGSTRLFDTTLEGMRVLNERHDADIINGKLSNYIIVLLTDGDDTTSTNTAATVYSALPSSEDATSVHIYTIPYGTSLSAAAQDYLKKIAVDTNGKYYPTALAQDVSNIYLDITSEV